MHCNDEKMALQSIFDSAFTEKIPGRGSIPRLQRRSSERQCAAFMEKDPLLATVFRLCGKVLLYFTELIHTSAIRHGWLINVEEN
jgi:hypothetical protein